MKATLCAVRTILEVQTLDIEATLRKAVDNKLVLRMCVNVGEFPVVTDVIECGNSSTFCSILCYIFFKNLHDFKNSGNYWKSVESTFVVLRIWEFRKNLCAFYRKDLS